MLKQYKILWLPGWYPSRIDSLAGDFIERHAQAVSKFHNIVVLFVVRDISMAAGSSIIEVEMAQNKSTYIAYYNSTNKLGFLNKIVSIFKYYLLLFKLYRQALKRFVFFDIVHVHVSLRQGLLAQWIFFTKKIKYVITEHNGWFMPIGSSRYPKSILEKYIIKRNFKHAAAIHVVSDALGKELKKRFSFILDYCVIPNVVNTDIFNYDERNCKKTSSFFAINGNLYNKNTDGIIRAFASVLKAGVPAMLHVAGPQSKLLFNLVNELDIAKNVVFYGYITNKQVAEIMKKVDAFIFFSRHETFGCVITEANCCGIPVIASDIAVLKENLREGENALFVRSEDEKSLTDIMLNFISKPNVFHYPKIASTAFNLYNYVTVGNKFHILYKSVID